MDLLQLNLAADTTAVSAAVSVSADEDDYHETTLRHLLPGSKVGRNNGLPPPSPPPRTTTKKVFHNDITAPPKPFADMHQYNTLQVSKKQKNNAKKVSPDQNPLQRSRTLPRKSHQSILPPPPQYKGVHFAPGVPEAEEDDEEDFGIPTEGLPKGPAKMEVKVKGETIPIKVRKMSAPVILKPQISESSSMTFVQAKKKE